MLPGRRSVVPADGLCALHATAVACGYRSAPPSHPSMVADRIYHPLLKYYQGTRAEQLIKELYKTRAWNAGGTDHVANPLEFRDFIVRASGWIKCVLVYEVENSHLHFRERGTCDHQVLLACLRRKQTYLPRQLAAVSSRAAVIFLHSGTHWSVLMPFERSIGLG